MGLVHHQQVPVSAGQLVDIAFAQEVCAAQDQLFRQEGIIIVGWRFALFLAEALFLNNLRQHVLNAGFRLQGLQTFRIEDGKVQVEAAHHFHKPLVHQR